MDFSYDDGGRRESGYKGIAGDCVVRAISIATNHPYEHTYHELFALMKELHPKKKYSPRDGVTKKAYHTYLTKHLDWRWIPCMFIGSGCKVHLKASELPKGTIIVSVSRHMTCVKNGVIHDTYNPSRAETRCVYGYYIKE